MAGECCPVLDPIQVFESQQLRIEKLMASNRRLTSENLGLIKEIHDLKAAVSIRDSFVDGIE